MMLRDDAVLRIQNGLGFRTSLASTIVSRLQEAQDELEKGKSLPRFLMVEDAVLTLVQGTREVVLPPGYLREVDDGYIWSASLKPPRLIRVPDINSGLAILRNIGENDPVPPTVYTILSQTIWFFTVAAKTYTMEWSFYKSADVLTQNIENAWLADAAGRWWLIGEAGWRIAQDLRDPAATALFDAMRSRGRANVFAEIIIDQDIPLEMGSAN